MKEAKLDLIDKLEEYEFVDMHGHPLENCTDWFKLKSLLGYFDEADSDEIKRDLGNLE